VNMTPAEADEVRRASIAIMEVEEQEAVIRDDKLRLMDKLLAKMTTEFGITPDTENLDTAPAPAATEPEPSYAEEETWSPPREEEPEQPSSPPYEQQSSPPHLPLHPIEEEEEGRAVDFRGPRLAPLPVILTEEQIELGHTAESVTALDMHPNTDRFDRECPISPPKFGEMAPREPNLPFHDFSPIPDLERVLDTTNIYLTRLENYMVWGDLDDEELLEAAKRMVRQKRKRVDCEATYYKARKGRRLNHLI